MKILVVSDSHRCLGYIYDAIEKEMPDAVLHLGDHKSDAEDLSYAFENIDFYYVPGNCDFSPEAPGCCTLTFDGVRIFMTHGHLFGVKSGLDRLIARGLQENANIVLFGHTHQQLLDQKDSLWVMNPGSFSRCGYGLIETDNGSFRCSLHRSDE